MSIIINFGKWKGTKLEDVPIDYLIWFYNANLDKEEQTPFMKKMMKEIDKLIKKNVIKSI